MILDSLPSKLLDNHYVLCSGIVFYSKNSNAATTLALRSTGKPDDS